MLLAVPCASGGTLGAMSGTQRPMSLAPAHLLRVGTGGLDAIEVKARGYGIIISSLGFFRVWRSLDALLFRRLGSRCWALFLGLHGVAWVSIRLPAGASVSVPTMSPPQPPVLPSMRALPSLRVHLTGTPPAPPEGLP